MEIIDRLKRIFDSLNNIVFNIQDKDAKKGCLQNICALSAMILLLPIAYYNSERGWRNLFFVAIGILSAWIISVRIFGEIRLFFSISVVCIFVLNNVLIWNGTAYKGVDNRWDYMDFIEPAKTASPMHYPPLSALIYSFFRKLIKVENDDVYVLNYAVFLIIMFVTLCLFILAYWYIKQRSTMTDKSAMLVALSFLMTSQFLFAIQRLNLIIFAFVGIVAFIYFLNFDNSRKRLLGISFLVLAANINYFPAVFGALLLKQKKWKEAIVSVAMGVGLFVLLLIADKGVSLAILIESTKKGINEWQGVGISLSTQIVKLNENYSFIKADITPILCMVITVVFLIVSLVAFFLSSREYVGYVLLGLLCIFVPSYSFWYSVLFLIPSIMLLICKNEKYDFFDLTIMLLMIVISMNANWDTKLFHMYNVWHLLTLWLVCVSNSFYEYYIIKCGKEE